MKWFIPFFLFVFLWFSGSIVLEQTLRAQEEDASSKIEALANQVKKIDAKLEKLIKKVEELGETHETILKEITKVRYYVRRS